MNRGPGQPKLRVVLADDHEIVRFGVAALLSSLDQVDVVAQASNGRELVSLVDALRPDIVLTDISMPEMDGIEATTAISECHPEVAVIVFSMHDAPEVVRRAIASGARGYVPKDASPSELEQALRSVRITGEYRPPALSQVLLQPTEPSAHEELTARQLEVLKLLAEGLASKEIGYTLGISHKTVDVHRLRIMQRLGLNDVASLTRYAIRHQLVKA